MRLKLAYVSGFLLFALAPFTSAEEFDLYFLGGQSNMEGFGTVSELPEDSQREIATAYIFHSTPHGDQEAVDGHGNWATLRPGHGTGFTWSDKTNNYSNRFGVELAFARRMLELRPDRKIAIIKYARNGSSIAAAAAGPWGCWDPDFQSKSGDHRDINQYDQFLATVREAYADFDIDDDGTADRLVPKGIVWMQGESDAAHSEEIALAYADNLKRLMDLTRAALRVDDLPVAIGRISDSKRDDSGSVWKFGSIVRSQQLLFCEQDPAARLVTSTDKYAYSDTWHYDSKGYVDLGIQFAEAIHTLQVQSR